MIRSMTGFGSSAEEFDGRILAAEARSVNSRHLRLELRLPSGAGAWDAELRELVRERLERGRVVLEVRLEGADAAGPRLELDRERVEACLKAIETLREEYALPGRPDLALLVSATGGLLREREAEVSELVPLTRVRRACSGALDELLRMREREGERLAADLREKVDFLKERLGRVEELAPRRLERERDRLRAAVGELLEEAGAEPEEDRLAREIVMLADKWDIGEEVVRSRSHLDAFEELLESPAGEAVGKRLDFLAQELLREINTMGAKANDAEISREVVEMKDWVEQIREQAENVE